jgi:hypothetical protein
MGKFDILDSGVPYSMDKTKNWDYNKMFGVLEFKRGWENQEIVYGVIQFVCITLTILIYKVYNGI